MVTGQWNGETFTANTEEEVLDMIQERIAEWCAERLQEEEEEYAGGANEIILGDQRYIPEMSARLKKI